MAYRKLKKPKRQRRVLQGASTENVTVVKNGTVVNLAVPCWYYEVKHPQHTHVHDREWHDHVGWPDPDHVDCSCQDAYHVKHAPFRYDYHRHGWHHAGRYLDLSNCFPIHLRDEGYTTVDVAFDENVPGLTATGSIDADDDHVVRILVDAKCASAVKQDVEVSYTAFVEGTVGGRKARDVVATGKLRILAGPHA